MGEISKLFSRLNVSTTNLIIPVKHNTTLFLIYALMLIGPSVSKHLLNINPESAESNSTIIVSNSTNSETKPLIVTIIVTGNDVNKQIIKIAQEGNNPSIISEISDNNNIINPNPVTGILTIRLIPVNRTTLMRIYSITGKELLHRKVTETEIKIDLENYKTGIYILKVTTPHNSILKKIIKK